MDLNSSPSKLNSTMDLNSSPLQLNLNNFDASCHQFLEKTMDVQEPTNLLVDLAEASTVSELPSKETTLERSKFTEFSVKPNQTMDLNSSSFEPNKTMDFNSSSFEPNQTMDLNSSPLQLNQSNVDANDNFCHQFREKTMDVQEPTNLLVNTAEASAESELPSKKTTLKRSKFTKSSLKPNQTLDLNSSSFKPNQTMDLNSSPLQLNQSNVDANGNSCHQFREKTLDVQEPTNLLVHTAKATAVSKLPSKMTTLKRVVVLGITSNPIKGKPLGRPKALKIGHKKAKKDFQGTVVIVGGTGENVGDESQINPTLMREEKIVEEIPLPTGIEMKKIVEFEFAEEDMGNVLQFLEFYRVFGKALEFRKEAGAILRSLTRKQNMRHVNAIEFQIRLLSLIVSDSDIQSAPITACNGRSSWLNVLKHLITESDHQLKGFPSDWLNRGIGGYYDLDLSQKLVLLNFICDEALGTKTLRKYIDDQNATFTEEKKAAKLKIAEAKGKERNLKLKLLNETAKTVMSTELQDEKGKAVISTELQDQMTEAVMSTEAQDEMAEAVMSIEAQDDMAEAVLSTEAQDEILEAVTSTEANLSSSDHETRLANLRSEADKAHTELLEAKGAIHKWKKCCDAVRVQPEFLDNSGKTFWKLGCCKDEYAFLLQDVKREDGDSVDEKWFSYGAEQKDSVDKYISFKKKFG